MKLNLHTSLLQNLAQPLRRSFIELPGHQARGGLNNRDRITGFVQRPGCLQPLHPAADDNGALPGGQLCL
ncbi:hypothetical protein D3C80_1838010 [compost metagenome]